MRQNVAGGRNGGDSPREQFWRESLRLRLPPGVLEAASDASRGFGGIGALILRFRLSVGAVLLLISGFMGYHAAQVKIATEFRDFFPASHPYVRFYREYQPRFGGAQTATVVVRVRDGDIFNHETLKKLQELTNAVDRVPGVNHQEVFSLASHRITYAEAIPGALVAKTFMYPDVPESAVDIEALKRHVEANRDTIRQLVSDDDRSAAITGSFNERVGFREIFGGLRDIAARFEDSNHQIFIAGEPVVRGYGYYYLPVIVLCLVAAVAIMVGVLYFSLGYRSRWWAPMVTGTLSAVWGLGFVGVMGYTFDPVMLVIPFILTARDMSHGIQWQGRYYDELDRCGDKYQAIVATTNYMLPPGFLSIVADIGGIIFVSLGGIPILHNVGMAGAVWLAASLTMVFVFEPIFLSFSPVPRIIRDPFGVHVWNAWLPEAAKRLFGRLLRIPVTPGPMRAIVLLGAAAVMLWGVVAGGHAKIGYSQPGTPLYRPNSKVNRDLAEIRKSFPIDEGWVVLTTPGCDKSLAGSLELCVLEPDILRLADDLRTHLLEDPNVTQVLSFSSTVEKPYNQMFHYGHPKYFAIPDSRPMASSLSYLYFSGSAPGEMERYIWHHTHTDMSIRLLLKDHTYESLNNVVASIRKFDTDEIAADPDMKGRVKLLFLGGLAGLYAAANDVLFRLDIINIIAVLVIVFIFCSFSFGSVNAGFLFVISCILANFVAFIYMGARGIGLTIDTIPVISLGIGLGVDYGIYVVARIQDEVRRGNKLEEATTTALTDTGAAVFSTFCVMIGGLVPWIFSPLLFHNQMSVLLIVLMLTNMIAGVVVLPTYINWARSRFVTRYEGQEQACARAATGELSKESAQKGASGVGQ